MTLKNILVAYPGWSSGESPLKHAFKIAKHYDAWLTGIVGHGQPRMVRAFGGQAPKELIDMIKKNEDAEISRVKEVFADAAAYYDRTHSSEILDVFDGEGTTVASFARSFDLVVTAPHSTERAEEHMSASPDLIALQSGRPVLIVPKNFDAPGLSTHVVVAWDGKRAAARAIGDAMSMLEEKGRVSVLTIGAKIPPGTEQLITNLRRHGINVEHIQQTRSGSIGHSILAKAKEIGADLIVMGAYEHSKFAHELFGGVTTDVVKEATVPVFMSH